MSTLENYDKNEFEIEGAALVKYKGGGGDVVIPGGVTKIGNYAFGGCAALKSVVIPEGVEKLGEGAFEFCEGLTSVVIPASVTDMSRLAFAACKNLKTVVVKDGNPSYLSRDGVVYGKSGEFCFAPCAIEGEATIPDGCTSIGGFETDWRTSNKSMGIGGFEDCRGLTAVIIPSSVRAIGARSFKECENLKSVTIANGVTRIGREAFMDCKSLTSVVLPPSVTEIGYEAFGGCAALKSAVIPEGVEKLGEGAFDGCGSLTSVVLPDGITQIGYAAFRGCKSLISVTIPSSVMEVGYESYEKEYVLGSDGLYDYETVLVVKRELFKGCDSLKHVKLPERFKGQNLGVPAGAQVEYY